MCNSGKARKKLIQTKPMQENIMQLSPLVLAKQKINIVKHDGYFFYPPNKVQNFIYLI